MLNTHTQKTRKHTLSHTQTQTQPHVHTTHTLIPCRVRALSVSTRWIFPGLCPRPCSWQPPRKPCQHQDRKKVSEDTARCPQEGPPAAWQHTRAAASPSPELSSTGGRRMEVEWKESGCGALRQAGRPGGGGGWVSLLGDGSALSAAWSAIA